MFRRHPVRRAQQVAPKRCPSAGEWPRPQVLPKLPSLERRAGYGAGRAEVSQASRASSSWWQGWDSEPGPGAGSPQLRLPTLHTVTSRAAQDRAALRSLLLPPLRRTDRSWGSAWRLPEPGQGQDPQRSAAEEDSLGALLEEFLPSRFSEFLHQLRQECAEQPEPQMSSTRQYQKRLFHPRRGSSQCHTCPYLADPWGQPSHFHDNFNKILLHQTPSQDHQKGNPSQITTGRNTNQLHNTQVPKTRAPNSSGEGLGHRRRCCPLRVRFADETLRDSTLRYLERRCTVPNNIKSRTTLLPEVSNQAFGNVQKWLENLPRALPPRAKEEARPSAWCWDRPRLLRQERQGYLSEDASMKNRLPGPLTSRATTQRQRGALRNSLDTPNILDQVGRLPCSWRPQLVSTCWQLPPSAPRVTAGARSGRDRVQFLRLPGGAAGGVGAKLTGWPGPSCARRPWRLCASQLPHL
ncbi:uncharacterized protein C9orf50 homolog [Marmota monax]|uniref:uncharacterized protein C9orf50 homolog n=1 Tax=Marmota monax TaxID=9995 RepID=UPI001EAFBEA0|nr:uncharacterized protein C9orf50 homolog [Marmota monax]